jgi:hypothetical protein
MRSYGRVLRLPGRRSGDAEGGYGGRARTAITAQAALTTTKPSIVYAHRAMIVDPPGYAS